MYKCAKCGLTKRGDTEFRVPVEIRKVVYLAQIKYLKSTMDSDDKEISTELKTVKTTRGYETVKELSYCKKHAPEKPEPKIVGEVIRKITVATKRIVVRKNNRRKNGKTRRYN